MGARAATFLACFCSVSVAVAFSEQERAPGDTVSVPILIYHSVRSYRPTDLAGARKYIITPDTLEQEFSYLKANGYVSVSFDDLVRRLRDNTPCRQSRSSSVSTMALKRSTTTRFRS